MLTKEPPLPMASFFQIPAHGSLGLFEEIVLVSFLLLLHPLPVG